MAKIDPEVSALVADLRLVWGRRVTRIDGDRRARLPPLGDLPVLDDLVQTSPWAGQARPRAVMLLLKYSLAYVEAGDESVDVRRQVSTLFGLDDKWERYSRQELTVAAQAGLRELERRPHETSKQWTSRERTWRDKLHLRLAEAVRRFVATEFKILPDQAHPLVLTPDDADTPPVVMFGRDGDLARLEASDAELAVITGQPGVGKTSVALALLQRTGPRYKDGVIQVNMNGYGSEDPLTAPDAMRSILARIGYAGGFLPTDDAALRGLYRGLMLDRQILVLLDNVADAKVAADLLLPEGTAKFVVTSRRNLNTLRDVAKVGYVELEPLDFPEAASMLRSRVGDKRADAEAEDFDWLVRICEGIPLPLAIIGGRLSGRPGARLAIARREIESRNHPLRERLPNSSVSPQTIIEWSLDGLSKEAGLALFALVGIPIPHWDEDIFGFLGIDNARDALDDLVDDHLVAEVANREIKVRPLIGWAFVEQEKNRSTVDPDVRSMLAQKASHFITMRTLDIRRGDNYRRWGRTNGYAYLADPRPLLPFGDLPERDDEFEAALDNCRALTYFAHHRGDAVDLVRLAGASHELSVRRGSLREAVDSANYWKRGVRALREANDDETLGPALQGFSVSMWNTTRYVALQIVRSGQRDLLRPLALMLASDEQAELTVAEIEDRICADDWEALFHLLAEFGSIPSLYVTDRAPFTTKTFREFAKREVAAVMAMQTGDKETARELLSPFFKAAQDGVKKAGTVELLWSFEPPLMRLASLEVELGNNDKAAQILSLAARLYGSNAARGWAASVLRFADSLGVQIRPSR